MSSSIIGMAVMEKVSVTLPTVDLVFLGEYMAQAGVSRSAAIHRAVAALRERTLEEAYLEADAEWHDSGEAAVWEAVVADGVGA